MAHTAHRNPEMMEELRESAEDVARKAIIVAGLIKASRRTVFFTGAGISTSAGIADYRGPNGVWTAAAEGRNVPSRPMLSAVPSFTHMAMAKLSEADRLHFVISQNVDGLHRRSGIPHDKLAELHGNSTIEECSTCAKRFVRDYYIHAPAGNHFTGRVCCACGGQLRDTIINFGEDLPVVELNAGFVNSMKADLHICLGSSLTVSPACDMPGSTKQAGGKLVIVNLQRTPLDELADVRLHCPTDDFMRLVMAELEMDVPPFRLRRTVAVWVHPDHASSVFASGVDSGSDTPHTLFSKLELMTQSSGTGTIVGSADTRLMDPAAVEAHMADLTVAPTAVCCHFFGHYEEPPVVLPVPNTTDVARCYSLSLGLVPGASWEVSELSGTAARQPCYGRGNGKVSRVDGVAHPSRTPPAHNYTGWFAVTPIKHCVHCESVCFRPETVLDLNAPCELCSNVGENMQCLTCFRVLCGRHVQGHMLEHHDSTGHPLVVGFADLSFWCYPCEAYVEPANKHLRLLYHLLHQSKFEENDPAFSF
jgi:NAD-dependent histone deacetylase SIR2